MLGCDEGISHAKTEINYSFPTNEQPPHSRNSCLTTGTPKAQESC